MHLINMHAGILEYFSIDEKDAIRGALIGKLGIRWWHDTCTLYCSALSKPFLELVLV